MIQSVRWGFYVSVKPSGEIYINQYADNRSSFYRYKVPSTTPHDAYQTAKQLPEFAQNIILQNHDQMTKTTKVNKTTKTTITPNPMPIVNTYTYNNPMPKPSAPPAVPASNDVNEGIEIEGMPSNLMSSDSFTTLNNQFSEMKINDSVCYHLYIIPVSQIVFPLSMIIYRLVM